jgi:CRISPR system Cascade subunit CasC
MSEPRFLQIHTLTSYPAALLNRDDSGLAKRLPYGGFIRTRVSSQCLKRHWRMADDPDAPGGPHPMGLHQIAGSERAKRSRDLVEEWIKPNLRKEGIAESVLDPIGSWFNWLVYSGANDKRPKKLGQAVDSDSKAKRQTLLFGEPELRWLIDRAREIAEAAGGNPADAFDRTAKWATGGNDKDAAKLFRDNIKAMREATALPGGLIGALFGRMVTSDPEANITAPVHVAHAFTVHGEESESDYFTAVDDLAEDAPGADTIQETELTSGLYYGYVVVDLPGLVRNLGSAASDLAGPVLHNLVHLIAEVSPGAKLGSTAPYSRASFMLVEAGDRQPRSLAEAFLKPVDPHPGVATKALADHLANLDAAYATEEERWFLSLRNDEVPRATRGTLKELAAFAAALPGRLA